MTHIEYYTPEILTAILINFFLFIGLAIYALFTKKPFPTKYICALIASLPIFLFVSHLLAATQWNTEFSYGLHNLYLTDRPAYYDFVKERGSMWLLWCITFFVSAILLFVLLKRHTQFNFRRVLYVLLVILTVWIVFQLCFAVLAMPPSDWHVVAAQEIGRGVATIILIPLIPIFPIIRFFSEPIIILLHLMNPVGFDTSILYHSVFSPFFLLFDL